VHRSDNRLKEHTAEKGHDAVQLHTSLYYEKFAVGEQNQSTTLVGTTHNQISICLLTYIQNDSCHAGTHTST